MKPTQGIRIVSLVVVLAGIGVLKTSVVVADPEATARKHAAKANKLAAKNKCKSALPWFNRAYRALKDPILLFNRAECLRKLDEKHDALRDYELFLVEVPQTPNRAAVEARIVVLREAMKSAPTGGTPSVVSSEAPEGATKGSAPAAEPADKVPAAASKQSPFGGGKQPPTPAAEEAVPAGAKPADKAPAQPVRRAEKWTD